MVMLMEKKKQRTKSLGWFVTEIAAMAFNPKTDTILESMIPAMVVNRVSMVAGMAMLHIS